jgi:hypothetical protein
MPNYTPGYSLWKKFVFRNSEIVVFCKYQKWSGKQSKRPLWGNHNKIKCFAFDRYLYPRTKSGIFWFWSCPPPETVWFPEARIKFVLHFNPYFVTMGHCPGGLGPLKYEDFLHFLGQNEIHSDLMSWPLVRVRIRRQLFFKHLLLKNY